MIICDNQLILTLNNQNRLIESRPFAYNPVKFFSFLKMGDFFLLKSGITFPFGGHLDGKLYLNIHSN